jgi:peptidoglycan hydrolase CwlO-like protein
MAKSILEHQRDLLKIQKDALQEMQERIFNAKYSGKNSDKVLESLDSDVEAVMEKVEKKRALINHYYGEVVI